MTKMLVAKHNDMIPPYRTDEPLGKVSKIEGFPIHQGGALSQARAVLAHPTAVGRRNF
jgi:hypothetical protein